VQVGDISRWRRRLKLRGRQSCRGSDGLAPAPDCTRYAGPLRFFLSHAGYGREAGREKKAPPQGLALRQRVDDLWAVPACYWIPLDQMSRPSEILLTDGGLRPDFSFPAHVMVGQTTRDAAITAMTPTDPVPD